MDVYEPYAFSDAVFIVRVRTGGGARQAAVTISVEDVDTGRRLTFGHERELVEFFRAYAEPAERSERHVA